ncbi:MAG: M3 family oligoendopeptidase [Rickettsiales bacterium]|nr:M3 family oligoendopeptidase [Rickettsiales bacterium]
MEKLPNWDLSDLYQSQDDENINKDITAAERQAKDLSDKYKGKIANLSGDDIYKIITEYEGISQKLSRVITFAYLNFVTDMLDGKRSEFYQNCCDNINLVSKNLIFIGLELCAIDDESIKQKLSSKKLQQYQPFLRDLRFGRKYNKSQEIEEILHETSQTASSAWSRYFDEFLAGLKFNYNNQDYGANEIFNFLSSHDAEVRRESSKAISKTLSDNIKTFAFITNTLAKDKAINDGIREFEHPVKSRNISNLIEDDVVNCLVETVKDNYPEISHKYYRYKAKLFGKDYLDYWDRNAPLPKSSEAKISWAEAKDIVLTAYGNFSSQMADIAEMFFERNWIDAAVNKGKDSGAFSHSATPDVHPYILLNYQGKPRDVMTLAHELGHGIHQYLARKQGYFMSGTPLTFAETASIFGEQLTFKALLNRCKNNDEKQIMIANKVEDMINTIVRQIAFFEFERKVHNMRRKGELSVEALSEIWMSVQNESLGDSIKLEEDYGNFWAYIPHFIHSPFYVYAYSFGNCLVNSLYEAYNSGIPDFETKYIDMLASGGTRHHVELLKPFGLDASKPDFWQKGLNLVKQYIAELN